MSSLFNPIVTFHDTSPGGWYCNDCKKYIHPDLIASHQTPNHTINSIGGLYV